MDARCCNADHDDGDRAGERPLLLGAGAGGERCWCGFVHVDGEGTAEGVGVVVAAAVAGISLLGGCGGASTGQAELSVYE